MNMEVPMTVAEKAAIGVIVMFIVIIVTVVVGLLWRLL
jgi:hypothetical protein